MNIPKHYKVKHGTADEPFLIAEKGGVADALRARFPGTVVYSHNELLCLAVAVKGLAAPKHNEVLRQAFLIKKEFPGATIDQFVPGPERKEKKSERQLDHAGMDGTVQETH